MEIKDKDLDLLKKTVADSEIDPVCYDEILKFFEFLLKKNNELNLISRKLTVTEIIRDHIFDCLAGFKYFKEHDSLTDLGSGGGFPGILLGIVFKDKRVCLIDKSPKKTDFLTDIVKMLGLRNVSVSDAPVENRLIDTEIVTCRAFKSILEIIGMTRKFFDKNGKYLLYKARIDKINEELADAGQKFNIKHEIIKIGQIMEKERHIVLLSKKNN